MLEAFTAIPRTHVILLEPELVASLETPSIILNYANIQRLAQCNDVSWKLHLLCALSVRGQEVADTLEGFGCHITSVVLTHSKTVEELRALVSLATFAYIPNFLKVFPTIQPRLRPPPSESAFLSVLAHFSSNVTAFTDAAYYDYLNSAEF